MHSRPDPGLPARGIDRGAPGGLKDPSDSPEFTLNGTPHAGYPSCFRVWKPVDQRNNEDQSEISRFPILNGVLLLIFVVVVKRRKTAQLKSRLFWI